MVSAYNFGDPASRSLGCSSEIIEFCCPIDCLRTVLSTATFNLLARAYDAPFEPPAIVGDVVALYRRGLLHLIWGVGRRRCAEIEVVLVYLGLVIACSGSPTSKATGS